MRWIKNCVKFLGDCIIALFTWIGFSVIMMLIFLIMIPISPFLAAWLVSKCWDEMT